MTSEEFFLANRAEIERAVRFVASHARLAPEDADELLSSVNLRLIENEYAVIRKFKGGCAFGTYVVVIARHVLADERMHLHGRFRPSAEAKRLGDAAILLEGLLHRQRLTLDEAVPVVQSHHSLSREEIGAIAARLPPRGPRPRIVALDDGVEQPVGADTVEELAIDRERAARSETINAIVEQTLAKFPRDDRVAFRLRWRTDPVSVADIARMQRRDQKKLYRRLDAVGRHVRDALVAEGVTVDEILDLTDGAGSHLDFGLGGAENEAARQPIDPRGSGNHEVPE